MRLVIIKEGPLVFLRNLLAMELVASLFFFVVSFLSNYELIFRNLGFDDFIRFDIFEVILFSLFQVIYITILFLDWYFSYYEIKEKEIIRKTGLIIRKKKSVNISDVASVETYQGLLERMMHHATIILEHNNGRVTKIRNVSNFEENNNIIKQLVYSTSGRVLTKDIRTLIEDGEGIYLEFKETMRYDIRKNGMNKDMERAVAKTIVGFLNTNGCTLLIGVNDGIRK